MALQVTTRKAPPLDTPEPVESPRERAADAWVHRFPSVQMVETAASMFTGHRIAERALGITLDGRDLTTASGRKSAELFPVEQVPAGPAGASYWPRVDRAPATGRRDSEMVESPRWRVMVSPGSVAIRYTDPARAERAHERAVQAAESFLTMSTRRLEDGLELDPSAPARVIAEWSAKSRSRMVQTMHALDWTPLFGAGGTPALLTASYPGDWLAVAPDAASSRRHLLAFRKRFQRAYGYPLRCVWKREFQRRGAPHYHLLMVPPLVEVEGKSFRTWAADTWAEVVGSEWCGERLALVDDADKIVCCERHRHRAAGLNVDYSNGLKSTDPARVAAYFSKHGSFSAKEYQNGAPREWVESGSVGRFWGVWGLDKAVAGVEIAPAEALAALRTMRRYTRARGEVARVEGWRYRTRSDGQTAKWRKVKKPRRMYARLDGRSGFLVVPSGPALAGDLARHLDRLRRPESLVTRSGAGPIGFLP